MFFMEIAIFMYVSGVILIPLRNPWQINDSQNAVWIFWWPFALAFFAIVIPIFKFAIWITKDENA